MYVIEKKISPPKIPDRVQYRVVGSASFRKALPTEIKSHKVGECTATIGALPNSNVLNARHTSQLVFS